MGGVVIFTVAESNIGEQLPRGKCYHTTDALGGELTSWPWLCLCNGLSAEPHEPNTLWPPESLRSLKLMLMLTLTMLNRAPLDQTES